MSCLWTPKEDSILVHGYDAGLSDRQIVDDLIEAGFTRSLGSVQHRRSFLKMRRDKGSRPSGWSEREDAIIRGVARRGVRGSAMVRALADAGYRRTPDACIARAIRIGACDAHDDPAPTPPTVDPLAVAMRKAHPDREGVKRSLYDKSVPARISGDPKFSVTGSQF